MITLYKYVNDREQNLRSVVIMTLVKKKMSLLIEVNKFNYQRNILGKSYKMMFSRFIIEQFDFTFQASFYT